MNSMPQSRWDGQRVWLNGCWINALRKKETFIEINMSELPHGRQIIKSTWAFCCMGMICKQKSQFVVCGDLQVLDKAEQTYLPVVYWSTVFLLFILTAAQGLKTKTIDFSSAFVQSDLPKPIYLKLPPGFTVPGGEDKVCKVSKSLYGDICTAKFWFQYLGSALADKDKMGLTKSNIEKLKLKVMFIVD